MSRALDAKRTRFYDAVGTRLRALREAEGMSRAALAKTAGISHTHLGLIESGVTVCSFYTASLIADALDTTLDEIAQVLTDRENAAE